MDILPTDAPSPRLCHLIKWPDFDGYGFNLHAEKAKMGQFIGKVDQDSPAEMAGLREGDRIIEVNGVNISTENHRQVVERIKSEPMETKLLVVEAEADKWYKENDLVVRSTQLNVIYIKTPIPRPSSDSPRAQHVAHHLHHHHQQQQERHSSDDHTTNGAATTNDTTSRPVKQQPSLTASSHDQQQESSEENRPSEVHNEQSHAVVDDDANDEKEKLGDRKTSAEQDQLETRQIGEARTNNEVSVVGDHQQQQQQQQQHQQEMDSGVASSMGNNNDNNERASLTGTNGTMQSIKSNKSLGNESNGHQSPISSDPPLSNMSSLSISQSSDAMDGIEQHEGDHHKQQQQHHHHHLLKQAKKKRNGSAESSASTTPDCSESTNMSHSPVVRPDSTQSQDSILTSNGDENSIEQINDNQQQINNNNNLRNLTDNGTLKGSILSQSSGATTTITAAPTLKGGSISSSNNNSMNYMDCLNLNMTASEMRELISRRKKFDPKKAQMNIRQKYEIIQQM